jgi:hypothetical protein
MADPKALAEREARRQEQERFLAVYEEVRAELMRIPGVVEVGVGLRERRGALTAEPAFRVYVEEKKPDEAVPPSQRIPKEIRGFPTDVITHRKGIPVIGFNDEEDDRNYSTKVGGSKIGVDEPASGNGTLGCFATLNADSSTVILSCFHVLMQDEFFHGAAAGADKDKGVGQPDYSASCCCVCNEIAKTITGDKNLDCAIARLKDGVKFAPKIRYIKKGDGTLELNGFISGTGAAVMGEEVWKVGFRTGLTRGTVSQVTPNVEIHPKAPFTYVADHGDSGSVVVSLSTSNVVGLLKSIDKEIKDGGSLGFATPIGAVVAALGITILATDPSQQFDVAAWDEERVAVTGPATPEDVFAAVADRLEMSERGRELLNLFRRHRPEVADLVNHHRPVTVTWHRSQGPTYLAALMRTVREPAYRLPPAVNEVPREKLFRNMREVLMRHGSLALRSDLTMHGDTLQRLWLESSTLDELLRAWEAEVQGEMAVSPS